MIRADVSGAPPLLGSTGSTTIVLAALLVVVGVAMICTAVWLVRATRADSRSLGPLEVMGDRSWRRRDAASRSQSLEAARPEGAPPPAPMLARDPDDPPPMTSLPAVEAEEPVEAVEPVNQVQLDGPVAAAAETDAADNAPTAAEPAHDEVADDEGGDDARVDEPQPAERS